MATTTSTSTTSKILTRFYNTLVEQQPDATYLATEVARIDSNATTLAETLLRIYQSPSVAAGRAEELAEAFSSYSIERRIRPAS